MLSQKGFEQAKSYINLNGRAIDKIQYEDVFTKKSSSLPNALKLYRNKDGGYGNGLEPDFRMPNSSPMATTIALQLLSDYDEDSEVLEQIFSALDYLQNTFDSEIMGWVAVPKCVNLYPHAPWWHVGESKKVLSGNPSAEIISYFVKYNYKPKHFNVDTIVEYYVNMFISLETCDSHELMCYIRLYNHLSDVLRGKIKAHLVNLYEKTVCNESWKWLDYVPMPFHFHLISDDELLSPFKEAYFENMDYLIEVIESKGRIEPTWDWGDSSDPNWTIAKREWTARLTLELLMHLSKYRRYKYR